MKPTEIDEIVKPFFKQVPKLDDDTIDIAQHLTFHFNGQKNIITPYEKDNPYFSKLIYEQRPNESEASRKHRKDTFISITQPLCYKVYTSLKKITKSPDWVVNHPEDKIAKIRDGERLKDYTEKNYPHFKSITDWMFTYALLEDLKDPNLLLAVTPFEWTKENPEIDTSEFLKPLMYIFNSQDVYHYQANQIAVVKGKGKHYFIEKGNKHEGKVFWIYTRDAFTKAFQVNSKGDFRTERHEYTEQKSIPCWRFGSDKIRDIEGMNIVYDSFISPMLTGLDRATRESSDLDAAVIQTMFPTLWYLEGQECQKCNGTGKVAKEGKNLECSKCKGNGRMNMTPYAQMAVKVAKAGEAQTPTPPAGYVVKDTAPITIQDERIARHLLSALSSINMQFLDLQPLNVSGLAKEVDRDELNNFIYSVARHVILNMKMCYKWIAFFRYNQVVSEAEIDKMQPEIPIPEKYDLLSNATLIEEIKSLTDAGVASNIVNELQIEFANKRFKNSPDIRKKQLAIIELDPLGGVGAEDIDNGLLSGTISRESAVISNNINQLVMLSIEKEDGFLNKPRPEQREIIKRLAAELNPDIEPSIE